MYLKIAIGYLQSLYTKSLWHFVLLQCTVAHTIICFCLYCHLFLGLLFPLLRVQSANLIQLYLQISEVVPMICYWTKSNWQQFILFVLLICLSLYKSYYVEFENVLFNYLKTCSLTFNTDMQSKIKIIEIKIITQSCQKYLSTRIF